MGKRWKRAVSAMLAFAFFFLFGAGVQALSNVPEVDIAMYESGENVRLLQEVLKELSLYSGELTGVYDVATALSVRKLQQSLGLPEDGAFTRKTAAALNTHIDKLMQEEAARTKPLKGYTIGIDPGHQVTPDDALENVAPNSSMQKERMSAGAVGVKTGAQEYEINLLIANKLKKKLENAGATVVMTRTMNVVSLSNIDRAKLMNDADVDFWIRLHANWNTNPDKTGAHVLAPSKSVAPEIAENSLSLAKHILLQFTKATGAKRNAVVVKDDQVGMNWSDAVVVTVEMGYLSNPTDDSRLSSDAYKESCAKGLYNGIAAYVAELEAAKEKDEAEELPAP